MSLGLRAALLAGAESNDGVAVAGLLLIVEVVHDARYQPLDEQNDHS